MAGAPSTRPQTVVGSLLADLGGVLMIVGVFLPYYEFGGESASLWHIAARIDIIFILLGAAAIALTSIAFLTGLRAAIAATWAIGLVAVGMTITGPIESAFHYGMYGAGFFVTAVAGLMIAVGAGLALLDNRPY